MLLHNFFLIEDFRMPYDLKKIFTDIFGSFWIINRFFKLIEKKLNCWKKNWNFCFFFVSSLRIHKPSLISNYSLIFCNFTVLLKVTLKRSKNERENFFLKK